jgi:PAS domain S-box-containing protein
LQPLGRALIALIVSLASDTASAGIPAEASAKPPRRVLVLYSDERLLPANIIMDEAIRATFSVGTSSQVEFYSEFLDLARFPGEAQQQRQRDFFRDKYRERPPHLVITVSGAALAFAVKYRTEVFAGAPVVHCAVAGDPHPQELNDATVAEIPVLDYAAPTLELALRLQPDTRLVAVVSGSSARDLQLAEGLRRAIPAFESRVAFTWLTNRSLLELRGELSRLPEQTVVLYVSMFQDADGKTFTPRQALDHFADASRAPIYGYYDTFLGHGIVGGSMVTFEAIGRKTARLGIRILAGEDPQTAARAESHQPVPIFDWRQLRRWNISEKRLPPGSVVRFRPPTLWDSHKDYVIGGLAVFVAEAATIAALLVQRSRRRLAEATTREDEKRMALAVDAVAMGIWLWDIPRNSLWMSGRGKKLFGYAPDAAFTSEMLRARVHTEDRALRDEAIQQALAGTGPYDAQYRVRLPDGTVCWIAAHGRVEFNKAGKPVLMRGVLVDITERKQAELEIVQQRDELAHLSRVNMLGELVGSLAHELNQPLTAILSNAQAAQRFLGHGQPDFSEVRGILADIVAQDKRASEVIRRLRPLLKKGQVLRQPLDVNEVVQETLTLLRNDLVNHGVTVQTKLAPALPKVNADRVQLRQVLLNLVMNATDAMAGAPPGGCKLSIHSALAASEGICVSVADQGVGLAPDMLEKVFQPFFTTKVHGLGVGLSVCRSIITAHGGRLWAANNPERGATFHFTLPVA